jgi:predicted RNase H-related nuclease YkuK (DUF458 family)
MQEALNSPHPSKLMIKFVQKNNLQFSVAMMCDSRFAKALTDLVQKSMTDPDSRNVTQ